MFGISFTHFALLAILGLILIGPEQLPEVARTIGRFLNEIKRSTNFMAEEIKQATRIDDINKPMVTKEPSHAAAASDVKAEHDSSIVKAEEKNEHS